MRLGPGQSGPAPRARINARSAAALRVRMRATGKLHANAPKQAPLVGLPRTTRRDVAVAARPTEHQRAAMRAIVAHYEQRPGRGYDRALAKSLLGRTLGQEYEGVTSGLNAVGLGHAGHEASKHVALPLANASTAVIRGLGGEGPVYKALHERAPKALSRLSSDKRQRAAMGFAIPGVSLVGNLGGDVVQATSGFIPALYEAKNHPLKVAKGIAKQYEKTYGPAVHGNLGETLHRIHEHPLGPLTDLTVVGGVAGKALDIGAMTAKGGLRAGIDTARGRNTLVPHTRFVRHDGGEIQFPASPNTTTRFLQHAYDRLGEHVGPVPGTRGKLNLDLRTAPVVGARNRIARRIPFEYERALQRAEEPAIAFSRTRRPLARDKRKDVAYALIHDYGDKALERVDQEIAMRQARLHGKPGPHSQDPANLVELAHQAKTLLLLKAARPLVENPPKQVVAALGHGVPLAEASQKLKLQMGELSPETGADALSRHSRMVTGGRFIDLPAPTKALQGARSNRDLLTKQFDKAAARRDENLQKLLAKETAKAQRPVPMTLGEAQARLKGLEAAHKEIVKKVETSLREHVVTPERAQQLLGEHDARIADARTNLDYSLQRLADAQAGKSYHDLQNYKTQVRIIGEERARASVAEKHLKQLERERPALEKALATGKYRPAHDKAETARRNLARRAGQAMPTLNEELRDAAFSRLENLVKTQPQHPVVKRYVALRDEIENLSGGIQGVHDITGGLAGGGFGREARKQELEKLLGSRKVSPNVPPSVLGNRVETQGAWLRASGHNKAERLGGALSIAEDRVQQLERRAFRKHGVVPGRTGGRELVGGEKTGEGAAFIPDVARMPGRRVYQVARSVVNKRKPIVHKSGGILFGQGRARRGSRVVLEDFLRSARTNARDQQVERAAEFAKPLNVTLENPTGLENGHVFYNPEGVKIARKMRESIKEDELLARTPREIQRVAEDRRQLLEQHAFPKEEEARALLAAGDSKLQQIDQRIAAAYQGGRLRLDREAHPLLHGLVSTLDATNNLSRLGVLYLKGAFVPANFLGNVAFGGLHQGPWFAPNMLRATGKLLGDLKPETLRRLDTEVGSGAAVAVSGGAVGPLGRFTEKVAHVSNAGADLLPRRAAIIYELRKKGYTSDAKVNALLDGARAGERDPLAELNQASETAERAMVQFRGMHPDARAVITRAIFIAPWLRGATKYGLRMPFDRPIRADLTAHAGQEGHDYAHRLLGALPSYFESLAPTGPARKAFGTTVAPVVNPLAVTPIGTLGDMLKAASYPFKTKQVPASERPIQYLQPMLGAALEAATGHNYFYGQDYPARMGPAEIFLKSGIGSFPGVHSLQTATGPGRPRQQEGSAANQAQFIPEHGWSAAARELGLGSLRTRLLNLPAAHAAAKAETRKFMTPQEKVTDSVRTLNHELAGLGKKFGEGPPPPAIKQAIRVYQLRSLNRLKVRDRKRAKLDARDRFIADGQTLLALHKITKPQFDEGKTQAESVWKTGLRADGSSIRKDGKPLTEAERGRYLDGEVGKLAPEFGWDLLLNARHYAESKGYDLALPRLP